jgi:hypothetical protein
MHSIALLVMMAAASIEPGKDCAENQNNVASHCLGHDDFPTAVETAVNMPKSRPQLRWLEWQPPKLRFAYRVCDPRNPEAESSSWPYPEDRFIEAELPQATRRAVMQVA